jgi:hypothetical protein
MKSYKNNLLYLLITEIILIINSSGCNNFLKPKPKTFKTVQSYFNSDNNFISAANGAYANL